MRVFFTLKLQSAYLQSNIVDKYSDISGRLVTTGATRKSKMQNFLSNIGAEPIDLIMIAAVIIGPIAAVLITRIIDMRWNRKWRKWEVYKMLMRTRGQPTSPDHVAGLNLVEVEFNDEPEVVKHWKLMMDVLNNPEIKSLNEELVKKLIADKNRHMTNMLFEMSKSLGQKLNQLDIFEGGYTPKLWGDHQAQQKALADKAEQMMDGFAELIARSELKVIDQIDKSRD